MTTLTCHLIVSRWLHRWAGRVVLLVAVGATHAADLPQPRQPDAGLAERIRAGVYAVRLVNTHEHLPQEEGLQAGAAQADFTALFDAYQIQDLLSAGMPRMFAGRLTSPTVSVQEKWSLVREYWENTRTTGYGQTVTIAARDLYGIDDLNAATVEDLTQRIRTLHAGRIYETILRERAGIDLSLVFEDFITPRAPPIDGRYFRRLFGYDKFCKLANRANVEEIANRYRTRVNSLADYEALMSRTFEQDLADGMVGVKSYYAYSRTLDYDDVPRAEAERVFTQVNAPGGRSLTAAEAKPLQDYLFFQVLRLCEQHDITIQIHTGFQSGNGNFLANASPLGLTKAFFRFPTVRFCLLHSSYPYAGELAALAKNFPNVYVDMAWAPMISPAFSEQALANFLGAVPSNKIMVFGGDCHTPEGTYGAAILAREVVVRVLTERVRLGELSEADAIELATKLLRTNAVNAYHLTELGYHPPTAPATTGGEDALLHAARTHEGLITHWQVLGFIAEGGIRPPRSPQELTPADFAQLTASPATLGLWTPARVNGAGTLLFNDYLNTQSAGTGYALTQLTATKAGPVTLLFGANVTSQIYLNGHLVHSFAQRFFADDLVAIPLQLEPGPNLLLVEVTAGRGHSVAVKYWDLQLQAQVLAPAGLLDL